MNLKQKKDRIEEISKRLKEIDERQEAIENEVAESEDQEFTDEQREEWDKLDAEYSDLEAEQKRVAADVERIERRSQRQIVVPKTAGIVGGVDDEKPKVTIPATVRRVKVHNFAGERNGYSAEERAWRFGQWALACVSMQIPGRYQFSDAQRFVQENMAAVQTNDGTGHFNLIPEEFGMDIIDLREMYGVARRLLKNVPMSESTRTDPKRTGGLTAYFTAEGDAITESNKTWGSVSLVAKDLYALSRISAQLSADAAISIGDDLVREIAYAFSQKEDECAFNGTGASTYGGIVGVRTKLQDYDGSGTDSAGLVTQGTGNTWGAITLADFHNVIGKLPQYADTSGAVWVCHKTFYATVMQPLESAAGGNTQREIREGSRAARPLFLGYPVEFSQVFPSSTATSTVAVTLGEHSLGASLGDRAGTAIAFSDSAVIGGESVFERNQLAVRGWERFDINVHSVGDSTDAGPIVGLQTGS